MKNTLQSLNKIFSNNIWQENVGDTLLWEKTAIQNYIIIHGNYLENSLEGHTANSGYFQGVWGSIRGSVKHCDFLLQVFIIKKKKIRVIYVLLAQLKYTF